MCTRRERRASTAAPGRLAPPWDTAACSRNRLSGEAAEDTSGVACAYHYSCPPLHHQDFIAMTRQRELNKSLNREYEYTRECTLLKYPSKPRCRIRIAPVRVVVMLGIRGGGGGSGSLPCRGRPITFAHSLNSLIMFQMLVVARLFVHRVPGTHVVYTVQTLVWTGL